MTSNSFIFTWQNLHYYSSLQCTVLSSAETAALPLALLKVLQADGASTVARSAVGTGAGASQSKQSAAAAFVFVVNRRFFIAQTIWIRTSLQAAMTNDHSGLRLLRRAARARNARSARSPLRRCDRRTELRGRRR